MRAPMRPKITPGTAMSPMKPSSPPRARQRRWVSQMPKPMPTMKHSAYARIGMMPMCQTRSAGLGIEARAMPVTLTDAGPCRRARDPRSGEVRFQVFIGDEKGQHTPVFDKYDNGKNGEPRSLDTPLDPYV